jgi:hypothetical protein
MRILAICYTRYMAAMEAQPVGIPVTSEGKDVYRIPGASPEELSEALELIRLARGLDIPTEGFRTVRRFVEEVSSVQAEAASARREAVYRALWSLEIDPVPWPVVAQTRRLLASRRRLLAMGAFTTAALAEMRGDRAASATRTWLSRQRQRGALFTVETDGVTYVPAFLLGSDGAPRAAVQKPLGVLLATGMGGWELWSWFASGNPRLGGGAPLDLLDRNPASVLAAAKALASNIEE